MRIFLSQLFCDWDFMWFGTATANNIAKDSLRHSFPVEAKHNHTSKMPTRLADGLDHGSDLCKRLPASFAPPLNFFKEIGSPAIRVLD